jgi:hypothetical protein
LHWLKKIWHDPVGSKVIATGIVAVLGIIAAAITTLGWWAVIWQFLLATQVFENWRWIVMGLLLLGLGFMLGRPTHSLPSNARKSEVSLVIPTTRRSQGQQPNFTLVGTREKQVTIHKFASAGITDVRDLNEVKESIPAFVFQIENSPGEGVGEALNVIATIIFRSMDGSLEERIQYGVWLNANCNSVSMDIGDSRELIVVCGVAGSVSAINDRRSPGHECHAEWGWLERRPVGALESVEIRILDQRTGCMKKFSRRVSFEGGQFRVGPDLIRS